MKVLGTPSQHGLEHHGLDALRSVFWNFPPPALIEQIILRKEGQLSRSGAVVVETGKHTGRSATDKYVVLYGGSDEEDFWCQDLNQPTTPEVFHRLYQKMLDYLKGRDVFVQDMLVCAHPDHQTPIRIITEMAWHSLFAWDLFRRISIDQIETHIPKYTIVCCPGCTADPDIEGVRSGTFIVVDFQQKMILIGGTSYAGEIKKSIFSVMNYELPRSNVLPMHCSANVGEQGDVALFFGLSGTGKTTLSSDSDRRLIGDDEHGWGEEGVFNFEGGCYAKTIRLKAELEPIIYEATQQFGSVLENVVMNDRTRELNFDDASLTENTRGAYPLDFIANHLPEGYSGHPKTIFFLTADAFGVLPPIARLTPEQAMYYFLSGYTSKLAGTEKGLGKRPQATFSTCFAAPFLPLQPAIYARLLGEKILQHQANVWLVNTGWTGGPFGTGQRMPLKYTRAMIQAALTGQLDHIEFCSEPHFGLWIPKECPGVPKELLNPAATWEDETSYRQQALDLIMRFEKNFERYTETVSPQITTAGPHIRV
jgi:phosphoenolpyruvate carboxykinase (ATP)